MSAAVRSEDAPPPEPVPEPTPGPDTPAPPDAPPGEPPAPPDADESEPGNAPDDEPESAPPPSEAALSEKEINKRIDSLEREKERHAKRIGEILQEESLDLIECEACEPTIPGYHYPAPMYAEGSPQRVLYELLAGGADAQMQHPSRYVTCDTCNGFGQVLTGARNDLNRLIICAECRGAGYHDREEQRAAVVTLAQPTQPGQPPEQAPAPVPDADFLGRPPGHMNYGKMTTYLTPAELAIDQRDGYGLG